MKEILGIDVGGSGVKAAIVDTDTGRLTSERLRISTPKPANPANLAAAVGQLIGEFGYQGVVGCCFPSVIVDGYALTAANIDDAWCETPVDRTFSEATGLPFVVLNDADAAGIAEMELGAGVDLDGLVITITIGTGIGSGLFYRGQLIPNLELGWMPGKRGEPIETYAGNRARKVNKLGWRKWGKRLNYFLEKAARVCSPDHFILGGGASKKFHKFESVITVPTSIRVAHFRNDAGIIGAAVAARQAGRE